MNIVPTNVTYTLPIVLIELRELVYLLNNDCFHTVNIMNMLLSKEGLLSK